MKLWEKVLDLESNLKECLHLNRVAKSIKATLKKNSFELPNQEIAERIGKTGSAVSYVKKTNPKEYELLVLGILVKMELEKIKEKDAEKENI